MGEKNGFWLGGQSAAVGFQDRAGIRPRLGWIIKPMLKRSVSASCWKQSGEKWHSYRNLRSPPLEKHVMPDIKSVSYLSDALSRFPMNKSSQRCLWWVQQKRLYRWIDGGYLHCSVTECAVSPSPLTWSALSQKGDKIAADRCDSCSFTRALFPNSCMECRRWRENAALQLSLLLPCSVV